MFILGWMNKNSLLAKFKFIEQYNNPRQTLKNLSGAIICFLRCIYTFVDSRGRLSLHGEIKLPYEKEPKAKGFLLLGCVFSLHVVGFGEAPTEMGGEKATKNDGCRAGKHGGKGMKGKNSHRDDGADQGGAGVKMLDEDIGTVLGEDITEDAAANTCDHAHENKEEEVDLTHFLIGNVNAYHGENAKTQGVHDADGQVIRRLVAEKKLSHSRHEGDEGGNDGDHGVQRIGKGGGRGDAQHKVTDDAAPHSGHKTENGNAENVHVPLDACQRSRPGKGNGADDL